MAAYANVSRHESTGAESERFSAALLIAGAAALFVGTLFYARLTQVLGLPALPSERAQALADALSLGPRRLALAGGVAFAGDCLLLAASIALACRPRRSDLGAAGWLLIAVSAALAAIFDSMTAALFWPLANGADPTAFLAFKSWFDFLFAAGNVPFGLGLAAVVCADARRTALAPKALAAVGVFVGAAAASSGLGYLTDLAHAPLVIGLSVIFGCIVLAALGVQLWAAAGRPPSPR
jgi:hypothetical protein